MSWLDSHFRLEEAPCGWRAVSLDIYGEPSGFIVGRDRDTVCRTARRYWGHMNHRAEVEAFNDIFPINYQPQETT